MVKVPLCSVLNCFRLLIHAGKFNLILYYLQIKCEKNGYFLKNWQFFFNFVGLLGKS